MVTESARWPATGKWKLPQAQTAAFFPKNRVSGRDKLPVPVHLLRSHVRPVHFTSAARRSRRTTPRRRRRGTPAFAGARLLRLGAGIASAGADLDRRRRAFGDPA